MGTGTPHVCLLELTCNPGLGFSLAGAYLETYARFAGGLDGKVRFTRGLAYTGSGAEGIAATLDDLFKTHGDPAVVAFTVYFWNREATFREIRRLKRRWPDLIVVIGGNDVSDQGVEILSDVPEIDFVCSGEGERVFATLLTAVVSGSPPDIGLIAGVTYRAENGLRSVPVASRIEDLGELPSPFLTGVVTPAEIARSSMVVIETNRGCPFSCAFCYWGGAIGSKVRRFSSERMAEELKVIVSALPAGATLFLADANFGMHRDDTVFAQLLVEAVQRERKNILMFVNWAKNTTDRVVETAQIMFDGGLIGSVTLSAQSLDPSALEAARRRNIPFSQYERLQVEFAKRAIPTYTELLLGLPPESAGEFRDGLNRVLESGGHPVIYPLLLLNNTEFATAEMRDRWRFTVRRLPYQPNDLDAVVDTVTGHLRLREDEWLDLLELALVLGVFHHALAGATIRMACDLAGISPVAGLLRLQRALRDGRLDWPAEAQSLFENHRRAALDPQAYDRAAITSVVGAEAIPDHLHYQAILHVVLRWLSNDHTRIGHFLADIARLVAGDEATPSDLTRCGAAEEPLLRSLIALTSPEDRAVGLPAAALAGMPVDALLLGIYHGAVRLDLELRKEGIHA